MKIIEPTTDIVQMNQLIEQLLLHLEQSRQQLDLLTRQMEQASKQSAQQIEQLMQQIKDLTEQNQMMRQQLFGRSSEKTKLIIPEEPESLFNEAEAESTPVSEPTIEQITYTRGKKTKGKREMDFNKLLVEPIVHKLPSESLVCPEHGCALRIIGHDVIRRELTVIPAQYKLTEHLQEVAGCPCCEKEAETTYIVKADVPKPVIEGSGIASPSLIAHIANLKYAMAVPLYRQEQELKRNQINIPRQNMANWIIYTAQKWLEPIFTALKLMLLSCDVLHADESSVQVLCEDGKEPDSKSYMWLYCTSGDTDRHIILFEYKPNRKYENPTLFLDDYKGYIHSDAYGAYQNLPPGITNIACWQHSRRKFTDILKSLPEYNKKGSVAMRGKEYCDKLYELERQYAKLPKDDNFKARYEARLKQSKPVMDEFFTWASNEQPKAMTKKLKEALNYALNQRKFLENVLKDGRLEISNNRAERRFRAYTVGRKNWLFSQTPKGATASAMYYSIVETAKANNLNPYEYMKYIFETAPNLNIVDSKAIELLLPWNAPDKCRIPHQLAKDEIEPWDVR